MTINTTKQLLEKANTILKHHEELERLRGEKFNIFSILKMESKENETHSAFLAELLSPQGSHLLGSVFLDLFIKEMNIKDFECQDAQVIVEYSIGKVDLENKEGGRIDILLKDKNGRYVSIENKIYAGDQPSQMERYLNFQSEQNTVFYLTLFGAEPSEQSIGSYKGERKHHCISYKKDIVDWLEKCQKEALDYPILRETIKQYILLINKLTHNMNNHEEKEMKDLIFQYFNEAEYIASNFNTVVAEIKESFRQKLFEKLEKQYKGILTVEIGKPTSQIYSQLWLYNKDAPADAFSIGIESFSGWGHGHGQLFIGLFNEKEKTADFAIISDEKNYNRWWSYVVYLKDKNESPIKLNENELLRKLYSEEGFMDELVDVVFLQCEKYVDGVLPFLANDH